MSNTKSYYIDINRFSAQDSESDTTNIWDYSLNDTIVAPAGSEVSIHQAFVNQKGITGQSIEVEEDINETINYYAYISEQDHSVPVVGEMYNKKGEGGGKKSRMNGHYDTHLDLLNNANTAGGSGRSSLWGFTPAVGTIEHLESFNFGGSGAPLILSSKPDWDKTQTFILNCTLVNPDEYVYNSVVADGGTDLPATTITGSNVLTFNNPLNELIRPGALIVGTTDAAGSSPTGIPTGTRIIYIDNVNRLAHMSNNSTNGGDHQMRIKNSGNGYDDGKHTIFAMNTFPIVTDIKKMVKVGMRCRLTTEPAVNGVSNPNALASVNQNFNLQVKSVDFTLNELTIGQFADPANTTTKDVIIKSQNNVSVEFSTDDTYYLTPQVLTNNIFIKKGTYGIEQLITIINNQFNGLYKDKTQIPTNPITEALIAQDWNGLLNSTQNGLTKVIKPIQYTSPPDNVAISRINPLLIDTLGDEYPDHTFVSAFDYAGLRNSNQLEPNTYNFTTNVLDGAAKGYVAYIQNNNIVGYNVPGSGADANGLVSGAIGFATNGTPSGSYSQGASAKKISDYQIIRGYSIGAPEFNIQFDTDNSAFSLNNLHSSYRIASHDKAGDLNANGGEVAVGIKSVADIADAQPWSQIQSIYGSSTNSTIGGPTAQGVYAGKTQAGTNIINNIQSYQIDAVTGDGEYVNDISQVSINSKITQLYDPHLNEFPTGGDVRVLDFYSYQNGSVDTTKAEDVYSFICDLPVNASTNNNGTFTNSREINFSITGLETPLATQKLMKQSYEKPLSRNGGVIVHNFAYETALKFGDRRSVVDKSVYNPHASFSEFFSSEVQARKIWKTKTLWGKLGFTYEQLNHDDYFENIIQYTNPTDRKLRGITTDTQVDLSTIPTISTQNNPSNQSIVAEYGGATIKDPQNYNNFDTNRPRTAFQRQWEANTWAGGGSGSNIFQYSGSPYNMATCINVLSKPTPISAQELPTLSRFGYYLITSDLVPTYKDIVAKGDPLGLLGVVPKTSLSNQDFIPLATSDLVQVLNQDTIINNIRVKILNPDLSNPDLSKNSSIILRIDTPIEKPTKNTEEETKTPKKK